MIFILDKKERVVNVLKNNKVATSKKSYFDDLLYEDLDTGASTFSVSTNAYNETSQDLIVGNYVAFKDKKGSYRLFQITNVETEHNESMTITIYSECAGLSLINNVFRKRKMTSVTIRKFIDAITENTDWSTGFIEEAINTSLDLDIPDGSCYSTLQTYIKKFGVEVEFRVELNNGRVSKKYIDTYRQRGRVTGKRFTYGRDIEKIVKTSDSSELYTALIGRGKNDITFRDVTVEGIDKPLGQDFVADQSSFERFNRNGYHLTGIYSVDSESPEVVLRETYKKLQEVKEPKISYEIPVILLGELLGIEYDKVSIGDQIGILDTDFNPPLMLSARVSKLYVSETNSENTKCVLSNFKEVSSNITEEMRKIASELEGYVDKKFPIGSSDIQEEAVNGSHMDKQYVTQITADIVKASLIEADKIITTEIEAVNGKFETVNAEIVKANEVIANLGKFDTVIAGKVDAVEGNFVALESEVGRINTLVSGNITSDNIHSSGISSDKLTIRDGFIKNAMIDTVNASKINAGEINTNNVHITSENGGIVIADNTQQFKDKNGKVRIQMGQDAQGNFNFGVFDATGTGVLIDADGIKEKAIADGLIKDKMIGAGEIGGNKINISSMIDEVNKDGNIKTIKGSKVQLDTESQTLDIAFNTLKTNVNNIQVGGRNLIKGTAEPFVATHTELNKTTSKGLPLSSYLQNNKNIIRNKYITFSIDVKTTNLVYGTTNPWVGFELYVQGNTPQWLGIGGTRIKAGTSDGFVRYVHTAKVNDMDITGLSVQTVVRDFTGTVELVRWQIEIGSKATDWTPAPEDVDTKIEANSTQININAGKIATLISDTTIEKNGENLKLKDEYSKLEQTVGGIKSTVGSHTTNISNLQGQINTANGDISNLNGKVQTVESKQVSFEQNLNEISQKVSSTESNVVTLKGQMATANNNITSVNNKIDGLKIGGRNLVLNSNDEKTYAKDSSIIVTKANNFIKVLKDTSNTDSNLGVWKDIIVEPNTEYTVSFRVGYSDKGRIGIGSFVNGNNNWWHYLQDNLTPNQFYSKTITTNNNETKLRVFVAVAYNAPINSYLEFINLKFEKGNKATDWTPAPEDIESDINSVDVKVTTTNNKVAELTTNLDGITQKVQSTESNVTTLTNKVNTANSNITTATELAQAMALGKMLNTDPIFKKGINGIKVYNNSGGSDVTVTRIAKTSDLPTTSTHCVEIKVIGGTTSPGRGGFYFATPSRANAVFITRFIAKIPVGYSLSWHTNAIGDGSTQKWLTSTAGTGKWTEYICKVTCGASGSFSSTNYFALNGGSTPSTSAPLVWYLAYATVFDVTDMDYTVQDNTAQITTTNNKVASIETNLNGISSKVSSVESSVATINGNITNLQNRMSTAESKITSDAIINTVSSTINTAKQEAINSANSSTDNKLQSYATTSSLTQTADNITAKFTSTGGQNLLKNSDAKNGQYMWTGNGATLTIGTSGASPFFGGNEFKSTFPNGLMYRESIKLKADTDYVYEGWIFCHASFSGHGAMPLHYWCMNTPNTPGQSQLEVLDYRQNVTANVFNKCYVHFRTKSGDVYFTPFVYGGPEGQMVAVRQLSLTEGKVETAWTQHPSEIYEGSTVIDGSGVTVNNGALRVKNNSGATVLEGDSDGNLTLKGKVINGYNGLSTSMDRGGVNFESTGENVGYMRSASFNSNRAINGVVIGNYTNGDFVDLGYGDKDFHTDNISYTPQIRLTKHAAELTGNFAGVQIKDNTRVDSGKKLFFKNDSAYDSEIYTSVTGHLNLYGDNGFNLGYKSGSSNVSAIQMDENGDFIFFKSNMRDYKNGTSYKVLSRFEHGSIEKFAPRIQNMNAYLDSGWYSFGTDCSGTPVGWGIMLTIRAFSTDFCQIVHGTNNVLYIRWYVNGNYTSWKIW